MMRKSLTTATLLLAVVIASPGAAQADRTLPANMNLWPNVDAFALDLYAKLRAREGNLFFSPYSISAALGMTRVGAADGTAREMDAVLRVAPGPANQAIDEAAQVRRVAAAYGSLQRYLTGGADQYYQLFIANALWGRKGVAFKGPFLKTVKEEFGGGLSEVDFAGATEAARKTINDWVAAQTKDKIRDLIGPGMITPATVLVLTNAIYFKAAWMHPFYKELTGKGPFYVSATQKVDAQMMKLTEHFRFAQVDGVKLLELPYQGNDLSMLILLPDKREGVADLEKSLTAEKLSQWRAKLTAREQQVFVTLPRFKTTSEFLLNDPLIQLGMKRAFTEQADFTGMTDSKSLFIGLVLHKAFVDVNEAGTEAAAATAVIMEGEDKPGRPVEFLADHPFIFLIKENTTGCVLFMGRIVDPTK